MILRTCITITSVVADSPFREEIHHALHESDSINRIKVHGYILGLVSGILN